MSILDRLLSLGAKKFEGATAQAHEVVESAGPGGEIDQKKYEAYARADAKASAREVAKLLGVNTSQLEEHFESLAVGLAKDLGPTHPSSLERRHKHFVEDNHETIADIVALVRGTGIGVRSLQLRHIAPTITKALQGAWKEAGFKNQHDAAVRLAQLQDTTLGMSAEKMQKVLETNRFLMNDHGEKNYTAVFIERGDLAQLHDSRAARSDARSEDQRERAAIVLVALSHLLWKIVEVNKVAARYADAMKANDDAERDAALSAINPEIDDNFRTMLGMFVSMFKRGTKNVAIGSETYSVGYLLALVEGGKDIGKAREMFAPERM